MPSPSAFLSQKVARMYDSIAERLSDAETAKLTEHERFELCENITKTIYPKYRFSEFGRTYLEDEAFIGDYEKLMDPDNYRSMDRKFVVREFLKMTANLQGDFAECGVYYGASAYFLCQKADELNRKVHLFDSFSGMSEPTSADGDYWKAGDMAVNLDAVKTALAEFDNVRYHQGWIPNKFSNVADRTFCFVHLDVDLYQPTLDSLAFFYPRLLPGGIIICDDYGFNSCPGATKAFHQFFDTTSDMIVHLPTGQGVVIKQTQ